MSRPGSRGFARRPIFRSRWVSASRNAGQASEIAGFADAVVVGSVIVQRIEATLVDGRAGSGTIPGVEALIRELAGGVRNRRAPEAEGAGG